MKNMGYVDGKTDADLLLEEGDDTEDRERIMILNVTYVKIREGGVGAKETWNGE